MTPPTPAQPAAPEPPAPSRALAVVSVVVDLVVTAVAARFLLELGRELGRRERAGAVAFDRCPPAPDVDEAVTVIHPEPADGEAADVDEGAAAP